MSALHPRQDWSDPAGYAVLVVWAAASAVCHPSWLAGAWRERVAEERQLEAWARQERAGR